MNTDFLRRIFCAAVSEKGYPKKGDRLEELYRRIPETRAALGNLDRLLMDSYGLRVDDISDGLFALTEAHEMQGFFNGFRFGIMLCGGMWRLTRPVERPGSRITRPNIERPTEATRRRKRPK